MPRANADKKGLFLKVWQGADDSISHAEIPITEYRFAGQLRRPTTGRPYMFRFDFAWPEIKLAVEVDGGTSMVRRTKRGQLIAIGSHAQDSDYEKLNLAAELGWTVLRYTVKMLRKNPTACLIQVRQVLVNKTVTHFIAVKNNSEESKK
jgi:very-short-patch-repair endonuclease